MGQAYGRLGNRFRKQEGEAYAKIVRDYPLSDYADDATRKLKELEMPVPEPDKAAVARMQYEKDHQRKAWHNRARHPVAEAWSGHEHRRAFGRPGHDHHAAVGSAVGSASSWRRKWRIQRRRDRNSGWQFNRARYQTRCSRESARGGCGFRRTPAAATPAAASPSAAAATPAAASASSTDASQQATPDPERKEEKEKQEAAACRPPTLRISTGRGPACDADIELSGVVNYSAMSRILLADDSPHAQRMGERILREEGFEVVSLTDGNAAMLRLADVDPDLILADVFLPGKSGFELCRHVKSEPRFKHVRVVLTAGLLEPFDEDEARRAGCDGILKKPFEASKVVSTIDPLVKEAQLARGLFAEQIAGTGRFCGARCRAGTRAA